MIFEEDPEFTEKALRLIGDDGIFAIQMYLMEQPDAGDVIPQAQAAAGSSAGLPKVTASAEGRG